MTIESPDIGDVVAGFYPTARDRVAHYARIGLRGHLRHTTPDQVDSAVAVRTTRPIVGALLIQEFDSSVSVPVSGRVVWAVFDEFYEQFVDPSEHSSDYERFIAVTDTGEVPPDEDFDEATATLRFTLKARIRRFEQRRAERRAA